MGIHSISLLVCISNIKPLTSTTEEAHPAHPSLNLHQIPGFNGGACYKAHDGLRPTYMTFIRLDPSSNSGQSLDELSNSHPFSIRSYHMVQSVTKAPEDAGSLLPAAPFLLAVESSTPEELEAKFNTWYDDHAMEVIQVLGSLRGGRYKLDPQRFKPGATDSTEDHEIHHKYRYLALYDWDSGSFYESVSTEFKELVSTPDTVEAISKYKINLRRFELYKEFLNVDSK
ncbi:hypothetical protein FA15DRAFT_759728 [Coprinopsis marcescibilis]|uniref:EthD domain-containing protein n=1 Tax=Coprinopsis marcescibilis TaxID=230819 RepID=A0A5C3KJ42_COPMA|nr:hypothetical protein FA15DRAFT_759728 [Coprinopsis marcescibilis]